MSPVNAQHRPRCKKRQKRKKRQVNWKPIIVLATVIIQVGGPVLRVWMEGRGGRL